MNRPKAFRYSTAQSLILFLLAAICDSVAAPIDASAGDYLVEQSPQNSTVWVVHGIHYAFNTTYPYTGRVELIPDAAGYRFIRVIDFDPSVKVAGGRSLSWVWEGNATLGADGSIDVSVKLQKADFVRIRGDLIRTAADAVPSTVTGRFIPVDGELRGDFSGPEVSASEVWSTPAPGGSTPLFERRVTEVPTHDAIPTEDLNRLFGLFASYHALPEIQPYVNHSEFLDPIHTAIIDQTDFDFYQQHPDTLRVVGKVIDPISLQETRARADAYKWSLTGKAAFYDQAVAHQSIDPETGMLFEFVDNDGVGRPSHDSALWTGAYVASQFLRYQSTHDPEAIHNLVRSLEGLLTLTEITGDPRTFARTLRRATGNPIPPWHAGSAPHTHLEWEQGGNNDMYKGLMYGFTAAHALLCNQLTGYESLCTRIRDDVMQIVNTLPLAQEHSYNRLAALWLAAYITRDPDLITQATLEWVRQAPQLAGGGTTVYVYGIADWSGTHLSAVQYLMFYLLADRSPLPGVNAKNALRLGIDRIYRQFAPVRMGLWSVAFAKLGKTVHPDAGETARWRLRELPAPKLQLDIDHRIRPDYVMSPFPSAPWKQDWARNDRTQSLRSYPLFEATAYTVYDWKQSPLEYVGNNDGRDYPGVDYLHAYWLGRLLGVVAQEE